MATIAEFLGKDIKHESDFENNGTGDLETVEGLDNIRAAILRRIMTTPGSVAYRPTYGVGILEYQGAPMTLQVQRSIALRLQDQLPLDPRIESVNSVEFIVSDDIPGLLRIIVNVKIKGYGDDQFTFTPFGEVP